MQIFSKHSGFTLIELVISILLIGGLALISNTIITKVRNVATASDNTMFNATNLGLGIAALTKQLNQSSLMRSGFINCYEKTVLKQKALNGEIELKGNNDQFSFVYSKYQNIAVSHPEVEGSLIVPDTSYFPVGSLIMLSSLDNNREKGIYKVTDNKNYLKLGMTEEIPSEYKCSLGTNILDPLDKIKKNNEKFAIANIKVIRYFVQEEIQRIIDGVSTPKLNLMATEWPLAGSNHVMVEDFVSLNLTQGFKTTGMSYEGSDTGQYLAKGSIIYNKKVGTVLRKIEGVISSTYAIEGIIAPNFRAMAIPSINEDETKATCLIGFRKINTNFQFEDNTSVYGQGSYRIYAKYSPAESFVSMIPTITISSSDPTAYCYREDKLNCTDEGLLKKVKGIKNNFPILLNAEDSTGGPVSCVPFLTGEKETKLFTSLCFFSKDNTTLVAEMRYQMRNKKGEIVTNTVSCSVDNIIRVENILNSTYVYKNEKTTCSKNGNISLGQLVNKDTKGLGPQLSAATCIWNDAGNYNGCSIKEAFKRGYPEARLDRIILKPEVKIENNGTTVFCD